MKQIKKVLAVMLALAMVLSVVPFEAKAATVKKLNTMRELKNATGTGKIKLSQKDSNDLIKSLVSGFKNMHFYKDSWYSSLSLEEVAYAEYLANLGLVDLEKNENGTIKSMEAAKNMSVNFDLSVNAKDCDNFDVVINASFQGERVDESTPVKEYPVRKFTTVSFSKGELTLNIKEIASFMAYYANVTEKQAFEAMGYKSISHISEMKIDLNTVISEFFVDNIEHEIMNMKKYYELTDVRTYYDAMMSIVGKDYTIKDEDGRFAGYKDDMTEVEARSAAAKDLAARTGVVDTNGKGFYTAKDIAAIMEPLLQPYKIQKIDAEGNPVINPETGEAVYESEKMKSPITGDVVSAEEVREIIKSNLAMNMGVVEGGLIMDLSEKEPSTLFYREKISEDGKNIVHFSDIAFSYGEIMNAISTVATLAMTVVDPVLEKYENTSGTKTSLMLNNAKLNDVMYDFLDSTKGNRNTIITQLWKTVTCFSSFNKLFAEANLADYEKGDFTTNIGKLLDSAPVLKDTYAHEYTMEPVFDEEGNPVLDGETGNQVVKKVKQPSKYENETKDRPTTINITTDISGEVGKRTAKLSGDISAYNLPVEGGAIVEVKKTPILNIISFSLTLKEDYTPEAPAVSSAPENTPAPSVSPDVKTDDNKTVKKAPAKAKIKSVKRNKKGTKATVTIKKVTGAKGYDIQVSTTKKFKAKKTKTTSATKTLASISKLKKKTAYYVRVRAYVLDGKKKVCGAWSAAKTLKAAKKKK